MFRTNYKPSTKNVWQGRIDSQDNFDEFRWHQWVKIIDLKEENLEPYKGKLGFAFIGFCCDEGIKRNKGRIGAAQGPENIRKELSNLPCAFSKNVQLFDAGNIFCERISLEESQKLLSKAVEKLLSLNLFPIVLGGGHETTFGNYKGILNYLYKNSPKPNIGIINFDAHFDIRPYENGGSSGTMFRQMYDVCKDKDIKYSYFCIGIQKQSNTVDLFKAAYDLGVEYVLAKDIEEKNLDKILKNLDKFMENKDHIYITVCSDVFASAFAPGVSAPQVLGMYPKTILKIVEYILKSNKTISFDIAEVSPRFDMGNVTSKLASVIIFTVVNTLCEAFNLSF